MATETNLAQLFRNRAATYGEHERWREKRQGAWVSATWHENLRIVNEVIAGLDALGAEPGDHIGILSNTRWEWMAADWAIIGLGAATVTLYPTYVADTIAFILNDSGTRYLFAEDQTQLEKLMRIRDRIPNVRKVILFDAVPAQDDGWVMSFERLRALSGRTPEEADALAEERARQIQPEDCLGIVYTSGTTGQPKGVIHTHRNLLAQFAGVRARLSTVRPGMIDLLFLPLAHVMARGEHLAAVDQGVVTVVEPSLLRLVRDLREVKPDMLFGVPRVFEKAQSAVLAKVAASRPWKRRLFQWAEHVGREVSRLRQHEQRVPLGPRVRYAIADRLVFRQVREALGGRVVFAVTGSAPMAEDVHEFFDATGLVLLEAFGMTETCGGFSLNMVDRYRLGTVGRAYPGHEIRIAADGEILIRGPCVFSGYYNNPQATAESIDPDGWFHTGDVGTLDEDGFLRIVDRKKDLIISAGGENIAPQHVENTLKSVPCVSQVCVYGDRRPHLVALLTLDEALVRAWADERSIAYGSVEDIRQMPAFRAFLDQHIDQANSRLTTFEAVRTYEVLAEDFSVENTLLTPTQKIRRQRIHERYRDRFESLYRPVKEHAR